MVPAGKVTVNGRVISVVDKKSNKRLLTESDKEMDARAKKAVKMAITKAKICKKPVAYYDTVSKKAYLEFADGVKKYGR